MASFKAVAKEGRRFLLVDRVAFEGGDKNALAKVHDLETGEITEAQPLQVWFKWGAWKEGSQGEYDELVGNVSSS